MCVLPFNIVGNSLHYNIISTSTLSRCRTTGFIDYQPMCLNLRFCSWKMRRGFSETLLATDATPSSGGATRAPLPSALARELWKLCEVIEPMICLDGMTSMRQKRHLSLPVWLPKRYHGMSQQVIIFDKLLISICKRQELFVEKLL